MTMKTFVLLAVAAGCCLGLERRPGGAWRARFRTIDMSPDMQYLDIVPDAAVTPKCDGYRVSVHVNNHNIYRACGERWNLDGI